MINHNQVKKLLKVPVIPELFLVASPYFGKIGVIVSKP
jgi:hypothetical protein